MVQSFPSFRLIIVYFTPRKSAIDKLILDLKDEFLLERESDMAGFLGLHIDRSKEEDMALSQTGLINMIFPVMGMENCNHKFTPAVKIPVGMDVDGDPCMEEWEYCSVVGMMLYLVGITCLDIAFAVHKCARFSHNPKRSYKTALKYITRDLQGTTDKDLILTPNSDRLQLDPFAGTDFVGLFVAKYKYDLVSVKSRTVLLMNFDRIYACIP